MRILLSEDELHAGVEGLAKEIDAHYDRSRPLTVIAVMTGSLVLFADLIRRLSMPQRVGVIRASSYHGMTSGELKVDADMMIDVSGRDVLLVDDIFDTGKTLDRLVGVMHEMGAKSAKTAVLLHKQRDHVVDVRPDFVAFKIPDEFVVGVWAGLFGYVSESALSGRAGTGRNRSNGCGSKFVNRRPRVLLVGRHFWPHGSIDTAGHTIRLAIGLQRHGFHVEVVTPRHHSTWAQVFHYRDVQVHRPTVAPPGRLVDGPIRPAVDRLAARARVRFRRPVRRCGPRGIRRRDRSCRGGELPVNGANWRLGEI